ncbi:hypothetical protein NEOLI_004468 [Neolecta irregularis DAH-3]|uniref:SWI5-dependent HO expression protein 3 n=1 Tax=Neolecta irregularis (strain DAH-3) TaxID=1198029 RepID=A0A1U7LKR9_NEOID|nr:hypothetical protein NEOLI_004468 [Neolecta irregularis DAH-3]|eukprot:OLL23247.1 hypothetical protein NEOLI_004468 [Neolecta irregularis DAH-3]
MNSLISTQSADTNLKEEVHRLRHQIAEGQAEIRRLEKTYRGVRSHHSTLTPSKRRTDENEPENSSLQPHSRSNGRSASTGRVIESLQKEIDSLKLFGQSAQSNFEQEKRSKELIAEKYRNLEELVQQLRVENASFSAMIDRKERTFQIEVDRRKELQVSVKNLQDSRSELQADYTQVSGCIKQLENSVSTAEERRDRAEKEYETLRHEIISINSKLRDEIQQLRGQVETIRNERVDDLRSFHSLEEEWNNLSFSRKEAVEEMLRLEKRMQDMQAEQARRWETALVDLRSNVENNAKENQQLCSRVQDALGEIHSFNNKIRAVEK